MDSAPFCKTPVRSIYINIPDGMRREGERRRREDKRSAEREEKRREEKTAFRQRDRFKIKKTKTQGHLNNVLKTKCDIWQGRIRKEGLQNKCVVSAIRPRGSSLAHNLGYNNTLETGTGCVWSGYGEEIRRGGQTGAEGRSRGQQRARRACVGWLKPHLCLCALHTTRTGTLKPVSHTPRHSAKQMIFVSLI